MPCFFHVPSPTPTFFFLNHVEIRVLGEKLSVNRARSYSESASAFTLQPLPHTLVFAKQISGREAPLPPPLPPADGVCSSYASKGLPWF